MSYHRANRNNVLSMYNNCHRYRMFERFLCQFGISTDKSKAHWHNNLIKDDPHNNIPINKFVVSFAGSGRNIFFGFVFYINNNYHTLCFWNIM